MKSITNVYAGVDISKKRLDVHLYPGNQKAAFANTQEGVSQLVEWLNGHNPKQIACEATGGYEKTMVSELSDANHNVWLVEPNRIKSFARSMGRKAKTDKLDAETIATFSSRYTPEYKEIEKCKDHERLSDLVKRRDDLKRIVAGEKQRLRGPSRNSCKEYIEELITVIEKQIKNIEVEIKKIINADEKLSKRSKILQSMSGIGEVVAFTLLAELPELGHIDSKQIVALAGLAPYTRQSGEYKGKAMISGGRRIPRSSLFLASLSASRFNPQMKEFSERLIKAGKPPKVARVAVMRKTLAILNVMLQTETMWNFAHA